jgi:hypothetical protein
MKTACLLMVLAGTAGPVCLSQSPQSAASPASFIALTHVSNTFEFTVHAPVNVVTPLFAPLAERGWAEGWDPQFVYPQPGADKPGVVFTVKHGGHVSTWIATALDLKEGHIQYVYFIPEALATVIDIKVSADSAADAHVRVTYERTALAPELNGHVKQLGDSDRQSGAHWQAAIESYVKKAAGQRKGP